MSVYEGGYSRSAERLLRIICLSDCLINDVVSDAIL